MIEVGLKSCDSDWPETWHLQEIVKKQFLRLSPKFHFPLERLSIWEGEKKKYFLRVCPNFNGPLHHSLCYLNGCARLNFVGIRKQKLARAPKMKANWFRPKFCSLANRIRSVLCWLNMLRRNHVVRGVAYFFAPSLDLSALLCATNRAFGGCVHEMNLTNIAIELQYTPIPFDRGLASS